MYLFKDSLFLNFAKEWLKEFFLRFKEFLQSIIFSIQSRNAFKSFFLTRFPFLLKKSLFPPTSKATIGKALEIDSKRKFEEPSSSEVLTAKSIF